MSEEKLHTETPPPPEENKTESEGSQSEVKKVVTFDIPENAEEKESIEEDRTPGTAPDATSDGGVVGSSQTKEDIDPRNEFNRNFTPIFPVVSIPGDLEIKLLRARLEQTEKALETLLSQMAAKQVSTVRKVKVW